ncbi:MAG: hypothetical protein ACP5D2_05165, partial [Candidatus Nanoarchaeia archaeon]
MENKLIEKKQQYSKLKEKYSLPDFQSLAEEFDIEKIGEKESSFLIRDIRKVIGEKINAYLNLFETFLNPSQSSMFVFSLLRNIKEKETKQIKEMHKKLAKMQLELMKLDTIYSEDK